MIIDFSKLLAGRRSSPAAPPVSEGALLGLTELGERVVLPQPRRESAGHTLVGGLSGGGKTVTIVSSSLELHAADLANPPPEGRTITVLIDPKADMAKHAIAGYASRFSSLEDLVVLSPFQGNGFAFNWNFLRRGKDLPLELLAAQLGQLVGELSTSNSSLKHLGLGPKQLESLQVLLCAALACTAPGSSPLFALDALTHPHGIQALSALTTSEDAREGLRNLENLSDDARAALVSRLRSALASTPTLAAMHSAPGCVDLANDICREGAYVVVNIGEPPGGATFLSRFVANALLRLLVNSLLERPSPYHGPHIRIILDESPLLLSVLLDTAEILLTTGRSRSISLVLCTQSISAIHEASSQLLKTITTNCPLRLVTRLNASDSELLVREVSTQSDEPISAVRSRLAATICSLPRQTFLAFMPDGRRLRFRSTDIDLQAWDRAAESRKDEIAVVARRYALPDVMPPRVRLLEALKASSAGPTARKGKPDGSRPRTQFG